jgi:hypothetical protein
MSRPVSVASSQSVLPPSLPSKPTFVDNGDLFATNLRLLSLDQLEDWPGITSKTFSTKDAQQNQKQRIRCTEWALFRLFEIWDPEDTRNVTIPLLRIISRQATDCLYTEATPLLSTSGTSPVSQPPRCPFQIPQ